MDFSVHIDHRVKMKESEKKYQCLKLARELKKKLWNIKVTIIPIIQLYQLGLVLLVQSPKDYQRDWRTCNKKTSGDHPKDKIIENGQNTEKSPGDFRRLAVTQTPG